MAAHILAGLSAGFTEKPPITAKLHHPELVSGSMQPRDRRVGAQHSVAVWSFPACIAPSALWILKRVQGGGGESQECSCGSNHLTTQTISVICPPHRKRDGEGRARFPRPFVSHAAVCLSAHQSGATGARRGTLAVTRPALVRHLRVSSRDRMSAGGCLRLRPHHTPPAGGAARSAAMDGDAPASPTRSPCRSPTGPSRAGSSPYPAVRDAVHDRPRRRLRRRRAGRAFPSVFSGMTRPRQRARGRVR